MSNNILLKCLIEVSVKEKENCAKKKEKEKEKGRERGRKLFKEKEFIFLAIAKIMKDNDIKKRKYKNVNEGDRIQKKRKMIL